MKIKKSFKNALMVTVVLVMALPAQAWWLPVCWGTTICLWVNPLASLGRLANVLAGYHLTETEIDATAGIQKIKDNIGIGNGPGVSATGATGADLVSSEEGAEMQQLAAESAENAPSVPEVLVTLVTDAEKNTNGEGFLAVREANTKILFADYCSDCQSTDPETGDCSLYAQRECTDEEKIKLNQGCDACRQKDASGKCISFDSKECARNRQNEWLVQATSGAEGTLDSHPHTASDLYSNLQSMLREAGQSRTVSDFWSDLQKISVQSNTIVPEITFVYAMDLLSTSERRVAETGVEYQSVTTEQ